MFHGKCTEKRGTFLVVLSIKRPYCASNILIIRIYCQRATGVLKPGARGGAVATFKIFFIFFDLVLTFPRGVYVCFADKIA